MALTNEQKREIANKLLGNISGQQPKHYPEHYVKGGKINDSHLCRFVGNEEDVLVAVKYVDRGKRMPCIGFFWNSATKPHDPQKFNQLDLPKGFVIDLDSITDRDTGWVPFCKAGCDTAAMMYQQIVKPGAKLQEWSQLFDAMKNWGEKEFGYEPQFYSEERGWEHTSP